MLPARAIERDAMLREFGFDVDRMKEKAKADAALNMAEEHKLDQYKVPGARPLRYDLDQIARVKAAIKPLQRKAA